MQINVGGIPHSIPAWRLASELIRLETALQSQANRTLLAITSPASGSTLPLPFRTLWRDDPEGREAGGRTGRPETARVG
jgi:hypothetical protein